ncbi:MAG: hypothetical protein JW913_15780 [Chitinispirillaceae bacterium]|nr:hypothetical protein [Chitinispirillaceae bacterium]
MDHLSTTKETVHRAKDPLSLIDDLKRELDLHLFAVREQREKHPDSPPYIITEKNLNLLYDHFQAIREGGERIDYNTFSSAMDKIEELIKKLRMPVQFRRTDILNDLRDILEGLERTIREREKKS